MCGIVGAVGQVGAERRAFVRRAAGRLRHRGPDADGALHFQRCSLAHTRLRILDLTPSGDQPMTNESQSVSVVFNGEIYNFAQLRADLQRSGHRFRSRTDTEVLVHLYEEDGDRLVERLEGMFAFAVWDEPAQRLLLGRDRLGIKPLYYRTLGASMAFASEARTLVDRHDRVDLDSLGAYLRLGWVPGPRTIWREVRELLPGHTLVWEDGRATITPYWRLPSTNGTVDRPQVDDRQWWDALARALTEAARRQLVADVPVGLFLSSGIDSAVVASLVRRVTSGVRAFTVAGDWADESADARRIAARLGLRHEAVPVVGRAVRARLDDFFAAMDQPTVDGLNTWVLAGAVREAGLVVALSGLGGDELFSGYSTFRHVPRLVTAARTARRLPRRVAAAPQAVLAHLGRTAHSRVRRAGEALMADGWGAPYAAVRGPFGWGELERLWPPASGVSHPPLVREPDAGTAPEAAVHHLELANYLPFQLLRDTDVMSMAHALEVRVPLLDDAVLEVALAGQGRAGLVSSKQSLVRATDPGLAAVVQGPKKTFSLPVGEWMKGPLRDEAFSSLVALGEADLGFDRRGLTALWDGFRASRVNWRALWSLVVLARWWECTTRGARVAG